MKRFLVIFEVDAEYIKDVLIFLTVEWFKRGENFSFYGLKWKGKGKFGKKVFTVSNDLQITEQKFIDFSHFNKAFILSLSPQREILSHREISSSLDAAGIPQLNPFTASTKADNKFYSISKLKQQGFPTPACFIIPKNWNENKIAVSIEEFLHHSKTTHFYIQPNFGTEGRETYYFSKKEFNNNKDFIIGIVRHILQSQPVIVKEKRGNVYFYKKQEAEKGYRQVVLRIIVYQITEEIEAKYGFAELSRDGKSFISSPERGGKIISTFETYSNLYYYNGENFHKLVLTEDEISFISSEAIRAFQLFNLSLKEKIGLCGIDFLLEFNGDKVFPVFLEINPRPAGLNRVGKIIL